MDVHYIKWNCIALHCIALHCIALHCIELHCIALHCIFNRNIQPYMLDSLTSDDSEEDGITAATSSNCINEEDIQRIGEIDWRVV